MIHVMVIIEDSKEATAVELCKEFEQFDGVQGAMLVHSGANWPLDQGYKVEDTYVGEFYTTPNAHKRVFRHN